MPEYDRQGGRNDKGRTFRKGKKKCKQIIGRAKARKPSKPTQRKKEIVSKEGEVQKSYK